MAVTLKEVDVTNHLKDTEVEASQRHRIERLIGPGGGEMFCYWCGFTVKIGQSPCPRCGNVLLW
jgi:hypothetical protein